MKRGKKIFTWILVLLLILACLLPLVPTEIQGADIEINGAGSGGIDGASSNATGAYNIWSTDKVLGYRFTLAKEDGSDGLHSEIMFEIILVYRRIMWYNIR